MNNSKEKRVIPEIDSKVLTRESIGDRLEILEYSRLVGRNRFPERAALDLLPLGLQCYECFIGCALLAMAS